VLWILFSDYLLLGISTDTLAYSRLQTVKGWMFVGVTAMLLSVLIHRELRHREKVQAKLREMVEEREALLKELNHRVRNSLQMALSILNMQMLETGDNAGALEVLSRTKNRLQTITTCLDSLYNSPAVSLVDLSLYLERVAQNTTMVTRKTGTKIGLECDCTPLNVALEQALPLGLIVNELIENSFLHAFDEESAGEGEAGVKLSLDRREDGFAVTVSDNGRGFPRDLDTAKGIGLTLVDALVRQIGGSWERHNGNGACVRINVEKVEFDYVPDRA
jgi:two-component sensor histidine kinase